MERCVWIFDLDGVLIDPTVLYERAKERAFDLIIEKLGDDAPSLKELKKKHFKLDHGLIHTINSKTGRYYLYTKFRFPTSLKLVYEMLCREKGIQPDFFVKHELYRIGFTAFDKRRYPRLIKPYALSLFRFLYGKGDIIYVLTKGDNEVQNAKRRVLEKAGFSKYWQDFIIVEDAKDNYFKKIVASNKKAGGYYSIGDTYEADIKPAIKAGCFGIYIPITNWLEVNKLGKIEKQRNKSRSVHYESLIEVKEKYFYLTKQR